MFTKSFFHISASSAHQMRLYYKLKQIILKSLSQADFFEILLIKDNTLNAALISKGIPDLKFIKINHIAQILLIKCLTMYPVESMMRK